MELDAGHYRIFDADYAIVGVASDIGPLAKLVTDALRNEGIRAGAVLLPELDGASYRLAHLLAQVKAVGVFEYSNTRSRFADSLTAVLESASQEPEWPAAPFVPRVYSAVPDCGNVAPQQGHLIGAVKAMREYAPSRLILTANGTARPSLVSDSSPFETGARPVASETRRARVMVASVA